MNETKPMTEAEFLNDTIETLYAQIASEVAGGDTESTKEKLDYLERLIRIRSDQENQTQKLDLDRKRPKQELVNTLIKVGATVSCLLIAEAFEFSHVFTARTATSFLPKARF